MIVPYAISIPIDEVSLPCGPNARAFRLSWSNDGTDCIRGRYFFSKNDVVARQCDTFAVFVAGRGRTCFAITVVGGKVNQMLRRQLCHTFPSNNDSFVGWPCFATCPLSSPLVIIVDPILEQVPPIIRSVSGCAWCLQGIHGWMPRFRPDEEVSNESDGWSIKLLPQGLAKGDEFNQRPFLVITHTTLPDWATVVVTMNDKRRLVYLHDFLSIDEDVDTLDIQVQPHMLPYPTVKDFSAKWELDRELFDNARELRSPPFRIAGCDYQFLAAKLCDALGVFIVAMNADKDMEVCLAISSGDSRVSKTYHFGQSRGIGYPRLCCWPDSGNVEINFTVLMYPIPLVTINNRTATWVIPNIADILSRSEANDELRSSFFELDNSRWQLCLSLNEDPHNTVAVYLASEEGSSALFMMSIGGECENKRINTLPMSLTWSASQVWGFKNISTSDCVTSLSRDGSLTVTLEIFSRPISDEYCIIKPKNCEPTECLVWISRGLQKFALIVDQIEYFGIALVWIDSSVAKAKGAEAWIKILEEQVEPTLKIRGATGEDDLSTMVCDALNARFGGGRCNDPCTGEWRRNKFAQRQRLQSISKIRFMTFRTANEALSWVQNGPGFPVIVKPVEGSGSQFCSCCDTPEDLIMAFDSALHSTTAELAVNEELLVEELLTGTEYVVNCMSYGPTAPTTILEVWRKSQKRSGPYVLYDRQDLLKPHEVPECIREATVEILRTLGVFYGVSHLEVICVDEGNRVECVELNARAAGHSSRTMPFNDTSSTHPYWKRFGVNQGSISSYVLLRPDDPVPPPPTVPYITAVFLRCPKKGVLLPEGLKSICKLRTFFAFDRDLAEFHVGVITENGTTYWPTAMDRVRNRDNCKLLFQKQERLHEYEDLFTFVVAGEMQIKETVDLFSVPGVVLLQSPDGWDDINKDVMAIRKLEESGQLYRADFEEDSPRKSESGRPTKRRHLDIEE